MSELDFITADNGWGPVERDMSNGESAPGDGSPLMIGGTVYDKGLGVHAGSTVETYLGGACSTFTAEIGLDDEADPYGSVVFEVRADGQKVYSSEVLTNEDTPVPVRAAVDGAERLTLRVTDGGDGNADDHADWGAATVRCAAGRVGS